MAYGLHWEWRGFGSIPPEVRARIEQLEPQFPAPARVTDEYLWIPGVSINAKLRSTGAGSLKFKRLRDTDASTGLELWEERAEEDYAFPVSPATVSALSDALALRIPEPMGPMSREQLLDTLRGVDARIKVVAVQKLRRARIYPVSNGRLILEIAEIESPQRISTVGIEDDFEFVEESTPAESVQTAQRAVANAIAALGIGSALAKLNYLDAATVWAGNGTLNA